MDEFNEAVQMIERKRDQRVAECIKAECKILVLTAIVLGSVFIGVGVSLWWMS